MRVVFISDTHGRPQQVDLPQGDILVHAGDFSSKGRPEEIKNFNRWIGKQRFEAKIVIAGNHDRGLQYQREECLALLTDCTYLEDSGLEIDGVKFWGSPWTPKFCDIGFNIERGKLAEKWALIPDDTNVLITHAPPYGILDRTQRGERVGCQALAERVKQLAPKVHVFGHIHEEYGWKRIGETIFLNASMCDIHYKPVNKPFVISI